LDDYFRWQRGYGVLSLGEKQRPFAEKYALNQKQHHQQNTTNSWLERMTDVDKGIQDVGNVLREPSVIYKFDDDFPF
jgi:REP-associated tyrosine transposase